MTNKIKLFMAVLMALVTINVSAYDLNVNGIVYEVNSAKDRSVTVISSAPASDGRVVIPEYIDYTQYENNDVFSVKWSQGKSSSTTFWKDYTQVADEGTFGGDSHFTCATRDLNYNVLRCTFRTKGSITFKFYAKTQRNACVAVGEIDQAISRSNIYGTVNGITALIVTGDHAGEWHSITFTPEDDKEHFVDFFCEGYYYDSDYSAYTAIRVYVPYVPSGRYMVTRIADEAFKGREDIVYAEIPRTINTIGNAAFADCANLSKIRYDAADCSDLAEENIVFRNAGSNVQGGWELEIGKNVKRIPSNICNCIHSYKEWIGSGSYITQTDNFNYLGKISCDVLCGCLSIGQKAFYKSEQLSTVSLPYNISTIESESFMECPNLKTILNYSQLELDPGSVENGYVAYNAEHFVTNDRRDLSLYSIMNTQRGGGYIKASEQHDYITTSTKEGIPYNETDPNFLWVKITVDDNKCYLYNIGRSRFLSNTNASVDVDNSWMLNKNARMLQLTSHSGVSVSIQDALYIGDDSFLNVYTDTDYGTCNYNSDDGGSLFLLNKVREVTEEEKKQIVQNFYTYYSGVSFAGTEDCTFFGGSIQDMRDSIFNTPNTLVILDAETGEMPICPDNVIITENEPFAAREIVLTDAAPFYTPCNVAAGSITYKRTFESEGWQPLYLPFAMAYEDWCDVAEVAYVNNVHQYDDDADGIVDRTALEFIRMKGGKTKANVPYIIRPFDTGDMSITVNNTTLVATPAENGSIDCSSTTQHYTLTGYYQPLSDTYDLYLLNGTEFITGESEVEPFRMSLAITNRDGSPAASVERPARVQLMIDGMMIDGNGTATSINSPAATSAARVYDLQGRPSSTAQRGLYVTKGGKKILVK